MHILHSRCILQSMCYSTWPDKNTARSLQLRCRRDASLKGAWGLTGMRSQKSPRSGTSSVCEISAMVMRTCCATCRVPGSNVAWSDYNMIAGSRKIRSFGCMAGYLICNQVSKSILS